MKHNYFKHLFTALFLLCATVATAHDFEVGGIYYNITDATNKTVSVTYKGASYDQYSNEYTGSVVIPESVAYNDNTYSVTKIEERTFSDCSDLTSIVIPNSVTNVGHYSFWNCTSLKELYIEDGEGALKIGYNNNDDFLVGTALFCDSPLETLYLGRNLLCYPSVFYCFSPFIGKSTLTSVTISNSVTSIGGEAFEGCTGLTSIEIPNSVTSICGYAFYGCTGLTSVVIGNSVTSIENEAFYGCTGLKTVFNFSNLTFIKGSSDYGSIAYHADKVINVPNGFGFIDGDFVWFEDDGMVLAGYSGNATELTLPADYKGESYAIGSEVFKNNTALTSVVIPNSVTSIGNSAFEGCDSLKTVINFSNLTFSKGSSNDGYIAYYADKVYNVPNGSIEGDFVFGKSNDVNTLVGYLGSATELTLPADCNGENYVIGTDAFKGNTTITSVEIPNSVTNIGHEAFSGCSALTAVHINDLAAWCGIDFGSYNANPLYYAKNLYLNGELLTELVIPDGVTSIGGNAFSGCSGLTSIEIPNSVTSIGWSAFSGCTGLKTVFNFSNLTFIKGSSDYGSIAYHADKVINASNGFIDGDFGWFENKDGMTLAGYLGDATELTLPTEYNGKSVTSIGSYAFYKCSSLTSIEIPNSVTSIGYRAFDGCSSLTSIVIPNSVTSIGREAFSGCSSLTSIEIPNSVTNIGYRAFDGCSGLTSVEIPNSVTSIGSSAFRGCSGLTSVVIPNSVTSIGDDAFDGCSALTAVHINDLAAWCGIDFGSYNANPLYYAKNLYLNGELLTELVIPDVTSIGDCAFYGCTGLISIVIGNSVTSIGDQAFSGCTGLTSIEIPNSVTSIGNYAFYGCNGLEAVHINDLEAWCKIDFSSSHANPLYYAKNLYLNDEKVTMLVIPNSVTSIGYRAFDGCTGLTSVEIPNSVTSIENSAFSGCTGLTSVVIGNSVTRIGNYAFYDCSGLKTVINFSNLTFSKGSSNYGYVAYYAEKVINATNGFIDGDFVLAVIDGVNILACYLGNAAELVLPIDYNSENYVIGDYAFSGCSGLTNVVIPNSVTSIGNSAFKGCDSLKTVINLSNLTFSKGSSNDGYIAYYADKVINAPNGFIDGDFVFGRPNDVNTLLYYLGSENDLTLPTDCEGEYYLIGSEVFKNNTTITSVVIPNNVTSIGASAFEGCANIENLYISNSLESIGEKAFAGCEKIMEIKIGLEKPIRGATNIFADAVYDNAILYVPIGTKSLYEKREPWNLFFYVVEMDFTGIDEVLDEVKGEDRGIEGVYYDLSGRAVENPANGIYILDGHKVIVK